MSRSFVHKSKNPRYDYESTQYTNNQSRNFRSYLLLRMYNVYYFLRCKMSDRSNESILNFSKVYIEINIQITSELILFYSDKLLSSAIFFYFKASYFFFFLNIYTHSCSTTCCSNGNFNSIHNWPKLVKNCASHECLPKSRQAESVLHTLEIYQDISANVYCRN